MSQAQEYLKWLSNMLEKEPGRANILHTFGGLTYIHLDISVYIYICMYIHICIYLCIRNVKTIVHVYTHVTYICTCMHTYILCLYAHKTKTDM